MQRSIITWLLIDFCYSCEREEMSNEKIINKLYDHHISKVGCNFLVSIVFSLKNAEQNQKCHSPEAGSCEFSSWKQFSQVNEILLFDMFVNTQFWVSFLRISTSEIVGRITLIKYSEMDLFLLSVEEGLVPSQLVNQSNFIGEIMSSNVWMIQYCC